MEHTWKSKPRTHARIKEMLELGLVKEWEISHEVLGKLANEIEEEVDGRILAELLLP